jgi:hypothetical protein
MMPANPRLHDGITFRIGRALRRVVRADRLPRASLEVTQNALDSCRVVTVRPPAVREPVPHVRKLVDGTAPANARQQALLEQVRVVVVVDQLEELADIELREHARGIRRRHVLVQLIAHRATSGLGR